MKVMKINLLLLVAIVMLGCQSQKAIKSDKGVSHLFKIVGSKKIYSPEGNKTVEYDNESPDHLYISQYGKDGKISSRRQFLFTGERFDLSINYLEYADKGEIFIDGSHTFYNRDESINKSLIYQKGDLKQQIFYYPDGQKQSSVPGTEFLNGDFNLWYPNGQLSFSGNYQGNLKNGIFNQYDESGQLLKAGVYKDGKLISGEKVVADLVYNNPEIQTSFAKGEHIFNEYLTEKAIGKFGPKIVEESKNFEVQITFDGNGKMTNINNLTQSGQNENELIRFILSDCPNFSPAMVENIPVKSVQKFTLELSPKEVKLYSENQTEVYSNVEQMPEFPGGPLALRKFMAMSVRYPVEALQKGIMGKVFVSFVIDEEGNVTNIKIAKGVHKSLDQEAIRVVKLMGRWKPGIHDGKPVKVSYTVPINFNMQIVEPRNSGY
jgi:TonB family protein